MELIKEMLDRERRGVPLMSAQKLIFTKCYLLWTTWASRNLPDALEWLLFLANSALWALSSSAVVGLSFTRRG